VRVQQDTIANENGVSRISFIPDKVNFDDTMVSIALAIPFKRVATGSTPIVTLSATADTQ
jgi:hypothetical protein